MEPVSTENHAGMVARALARLGGPIAAAWIRAQQRSYGRGARALDDAERDALAGYFPDSLLADVRLAIARRVSFPGVGGLASRVRGVRAPETIAAITFGDLVVMTERTRASGRAVSVLFHELVHVAQYRTLGVRGFAERYVRGWLANGRSYERIPLEVDAYELQARFDGGEGAVFDVTAEVLRRLGAGRATPRAKLTLKNSEQSLRAGNLHHERSEA